MAFAKMCVTLVKGLFLAETYLLMHGVFDPRNHELCFDSEQTCEKAIQTHIDSNTRWEQQSALPITEEERESKA